MRNERLREFAQPCQLISNEAGIKQGNQREAEKFEWCNVSEAKNRKGLKAMLTAISSTKESLKNIWLPTMCSIEL